MSTPNQITTPPVDATVPGKKTLLQQLFEAVQSYGEPMTCREVVELLPPDVNDASVSSYLNQLTTVGVFRCDKPSEGPRKYSLIEGKTLADFSSMAYKAISKGKPSKRLGRGYNSRKTAALTKPTTAPVGPAVPTPEPAPKLKSEVSRAAAPEGVRIEAQLTLHVGGHRLAVSMREARQLFDALKEVLG